MRMTNNYFEYVFINMKSLLVIRKYILLNAISEQSASYRAKITLQAQKWECNHNKHKPERYLASSN